MAFNCPADSFPSGVSFVCSDGAAASFNQNRFCMGDFDGTGSGSIARCYEQVPTADNTLTLTISCTETGAAPGICSQDTTTPVLGTFILSNELDTEGYKKWISTDIVVGNLDASNGGGTCNVNEDGPQTVSLSYGEKASRGIQSYTANWFVDMLKTPAAIPTFDIYVYFKIKEVEWPPGAGTREGNTVILRAQFDKTFCGATPYAGITLADDYFESCFVCCNSRNGGLVGSSWCSINISLGIV